MAIDSEGLHEIANTASEDLQADIVFVHGLGGASHATWRHGQQGKAGHFFWPEELGRDLPRCGIWTAGYPAGFTALGKPGMILEKRAGNLAHKLANAGLGARPLLFITHSMGGLIVKALIAGSQTIADADRKRLVGMVRGLVLCATPHRGSAFADAAGVLGLFLGGSQDHVKEMRANADPLDILHDQFIEWHRQHPIPVQSYAENIGLFRQRRLLRPLPLGLVVPRASANPGIAGHTVRDCDDDHLTLVKPRDRHHDVYAGVLRFVRETLALSLKPGTPKMADDRIFKFDTNSEFEVVRPNTLSVSRLPAGASDLDSVVVNDVSVFISYSHDSEEHRERVLGLSERLRADGIPTVLDRYVDKGAPDEGWPRWMMNALESATHVLCICTPAYRRRFLGREVPGKGKGADWEGALVSQALYDAGSRGNKFIPVLFAKADVDQVPEPMRSRTHYVLDSAASYEALYDALLGQSGVQPAAVGAPKRKPRTAGQSMNFDEEQTSLAPTLQEHQVVEAETLSREPYRWPAAWDFSAYMADKREVFEGRDWLFRDIAEWQAQGTTRALLIRADFGVGKSAIMAELVHREAETTLAAWHFCQHDTQETLSPAAFVRNVAAQFKQNIPGYREAVEADAEARRQLDRVLEDPASAFEAAVILPLRRLQAPHGGRTLMIDALDEALELNGAIKDRFGTIVRLLATRAGRFPAWLRVLATSRNNPSVIGPLQSAFGLKEIDAESKFNRDDLYRYARSRAEREPLNAQLLAAGHRSDSVATLVCDRSLGKFLYAVRAMEDLEKGTFGIDELARLPPGMDSFYLDAFERRFARTGHNYEAARDVLGVLAAVREPVPFALISHVLGVPEAQVKAVRLALPDFLRVRAGCLTFDHFSLAEWVTGETEQCFPRAGAYAVDIPASRDRLHRWAIKHVEAGTAQSQRYLVRHLAAHLSDTDELQRVFCELMLGDFSWLAAKLASEGIEALMADCVYLRDAPDALTLEMLLRNGAHVLRVHPEQLPAQVMGRLGPQPEEGSPLAKLVVSAKRWLHWPSNNLPAGRLLLPTSRSLSLSGSLVALLLGHQGPVTALVALPGGRIASGGLDGTVRVWESRGRHDAIVFEGHEGEILSLSALPDGRVVSSSRDSTVRVWDPQGGRPAQNFQSACNRYGGLAVLPDGRIASRRGNTLRVIDPEGLQMAQAFEGHALLASDPLVMPDGRIAFVDDDALRVLDPLGRIKTQVFEGLTRGVTTLKALLDGRIAFVSDDYKVRVLDLQGRQPTMVFEGHKDIVDRLAVLPDGSLVSGSSDGTLRVWDPSGRRESQVCAWHWGGCYALAILPDGRIASGCQDSVVRVWDPNELQEPQVFEGHAGSVNALTVLDDGNVASCSDDGTIRIWNPKGPRKAQSFEGHRAYVWALAALPDGRVASASEDGDVRVWDPHGHQRTKLFTEHTRGVLALAVLPGGYVASSSWDGTLRIWNPENGQVTKMYEDTKWSSEFLIVLPDRRIAFAGHNSSVVVWDPEGRHSVQVFEGHEDSIESLTLLSDGRIASGSRDKTVRVWDPQCRQLAQVCRGHADYVRALVALPDHRVMSGSNDGTARLWDLQDRQPVSLIELDVGSPHALAVLADGRIAAGSRDYTFQVVDPQERRVPQVFRGHSRLITALLEMPNNRIVSGSLDNTVRVWDILTGMEVAMFHADAGISKICLSRDMVVAADNSGAIHFLRQKGTD